MVRRFSHGQRGPLRGAHPLCGTLSRRGLTKLGYTHHIGQMAGPITASTFNRLGQYANSPGNRVYCNAKLTVSSLAVAETIASTHCAYRLRDGEAE